MDPQLRVINRMPDNPPRQTLKCFSFFPVLDVVMIGDDVRDDVNGGINYGLMVCNR